MSDIIKLDIAYEDERGIILDIFESEPKEHGSLITFNKGSRRANHFHKESTQYLFLISGNLIMRSGEVDDDGNFKDKIKQDIIKPHMLVTHKPYEAHAFEASENSTILALRADSGGKNYEKDVYRLIMNMFDQ